MVKLKLFWKLIAWLIIISFLSLMPGDNLPKNHFWDIPHLDKLVHFTMYFVLFILFIKPLRRYFKHPLSIGFVAAFVISGIFEVLQQYLTNNRDGNSLDLLANFMGIIIALLVYIYILKNSLLGKYL